jgi:opacity protein-like surface antigen
MKKLFLAAIMAVSATFAQAADPYFQIANSWQENRVTGANSIAPDVVIGVKDGNWQYSGMAQFSQPELGNGAITNSVEGRVRYNFNPVTSFKLKPWSQLRLGEQITSTNNFSYYAVDLGLTVPLSPVVDVDFGYRYRNAFNTSNNFETDRLGVEGRYKFTNKDTIGLRYGRSYGDSETNAWRLQYTRAF